MAIKYDQMNVDEKYASILEPNLYYNPVMVPGVTFTDKYQTGPPARFSCTRCPRPQLKPVPPAGTLPTRRWRTP